MQSNTLFDGDRMTLDQAVQLTAESLCAYAARYRHWAIAFSGGKDSSAALTVALHLIETERVPRPASLSVLNSDTRLELTPLQICAESIMASVRKKGWTATTVLPDLDDRFFVYMLGRGIPPPKNRFRWCTSQLKIEPMIASLKEANERAGEKMLMLTGVRLGESAARDDRIALSCSRDGAECGQGWFQTSTPNSVADTLAPIVHWRICHVWDWLTEHAPRFGFPTTRFIADAYGGQNDMQALIDTNARTGCICCPLVEHDTALERLISTPHWAYLAPLLRLRELWAELRLFRNRLQKNGERKKDGTLSANPMRKGPLTMEARKMAVRFVLGIQDDVNVEARRQGRPEVVLINDEELARIRELIESNLWPDGWSGEEEVGDVLLPEIRRDGTTLPLLQFEE
jgi:DNA sulfur modification protein DndC